MGRISVSRPHQSLFCSQDWEIKATIKQNNEEEIVQNDVSQALARHHPPNCTFLKVYMELSSYFLFLQEQIKDIIINKQLRMHVKQSLDDIRNGTIGVDEARKQVLANRIAAAKEVIQAIPEDKQAHMPFRNKEQQLLLKRKSKLASELREALAKKRVDTESTDVHVLPWAHCTTAYVEAGKRSHGGYCAMENTAESRNPELY